MEEEDEDDTWQDGSDDELTVNKLSIATQHLEPTQTTTTTSPVNATGGGWFASLGNAFASSSSSTNTSTTPTPTSATTRNVLRRQPSAKDVALALSPSSNSPSFSSSSKPPPPPLPSNLKSSTGPLKRGGSYISGVNAVQEEADRVVKEEIRRNSNEPLTVEDEEEKGEGEKKASEKEKLRKSVRGDIYELVKGTLLILLSHSFGNSAD